MSDVKEFVVKLDRVTGSELWHTHIKVFEDMIQERDRQQFEAGRAMGKDEGWGAGRKEAAREAGNATSYHSERERMKGLSLRERRQHSVRRPEAFDINVAILQLTPPAAQPASELAKR